MKKLEGIINFSKDKGKIVEKIKSLMKTALLLTMLTETNAEKINLNLNSWWNLVAIPGKSKEVKSVLEKEWIRIIWEYDNKQSLFLKSV